MNTRITQLEEALKKIQIGGHSYDLNERLSDIKMADIAAAALASPLLPQQGGETTDAKLKPTETGIYAWVADGCASLVIVNKRPSAHSPGGVLNGHLMQNSNFYDGCAVEKWSGGRWFGPLSSDAAALPQESKATVVFSPCIGWVDDGGIVFWEGGVCPADGSKLYAAPASLGEAKAVAPEGWKPDWEHVANEWADVACAALQWLRNLRDGISDASTAISSTTDGITHAREVEREVRNAAPVAQALPLNANGIALNTPNADVPVPSKSWLWCQLMDWCKKRGVAPANHDDLFAICDRIEALPVAAEKDAARYLCLISADWREAETRELQDAIKTMWEIADGDDVADKCIMDADVDAVIALQGEKT